MTKKLIEFSGYLIQKRAFRNTGLIATFFTEHGELLSGIIHGGQKKNLAIFQPYYGQVYLREGLSLFAKLEISAPAHNFPGSLMFCGLYANELLGHLGKGLTEADSVYHAYQNLLHNPSTQAVEPNLRIFENTLLTELGFELDFEFDVEGNSIQKTLHYVLLADIGFRKATSNELETENVFLIQGEILSTLKNLDNAPHNSLSISKKINRYRINHLLDGKKLISRELFV